jgi:hypothetical protein
MTARIQHRKNGALDIVIDFVPLEIIPLMRTRLYRDISGDPPFRLWARTAEALFAARRERETYLAQARDGEIGHAEGA